ncbi:hypothetical protein [Fulvimarina sp. MAC3]|uniref:hypothetical protein n=1 Tax=Fulvimarina sp. MAC3 TaxID=3148887 RepID=UPI0031FD5B5F
MIKILTWTTYVMRLFAVLAVMLGSGIQMSVASASEDALTRTSALTASDMPSGDVHARHHHVDIDQPAHDHGRGAVSDCGIHCVSSLPQIFVPRFSLPVTLDVVFMTFSDEFSGRSVATLERPPRI